MNKSEKEQIDVLLEKYNAILLYSMSIAIAEDFINLIIVNNDDSNFKLNHLMKDKTEFRKYVTSKFLKYNSSSLSLELSKMDEIKFDLNPKKKPKSNLV